MFRLQLFTAFLLVLIASACTLSLPSYLSKCNKEDPKFNECMKNSANNGLPMVLKGDKKFKIPNMLPFRLNLITIEPSPQLKLFVKEADIFGLDGTVITDVKADFKKNKIVINAVIPRLELQGQYEIKGRLLILPITGNGASNITLVGGNYVYTMHFKTKNKKGKEYYTIDQDDCDFTITKAYYDFQNLFNGDKVLGPQMNQIMNENWEDVTKELKPGISKAISTVVSSVIEIVLKQVPADGVF